jgi:hypothetical protein
MPNLEVVYLYGNLHLYDYSFHSLYDAIPTQMLDISPLSTSEKLWDILCQNFIIKNLSSLDVLRNVSHGIDLHGSRLYDETEKSRHYFSLERVSER